MANEHKFYYTTNIIVFLSGSVKSEGSKVYRSINRILGQCDANIRIGPADKDNNPERDTLGIPGHEGPFIGVYMRKEDRDKFPFRPKLDLSLDEALSKFDEKAEEKPPEEKPDEAAGQ